MLNLTANLNDGVSRMADCRVSVVLPTFNRAAALGRAIQSVLAQTHRNLELIVVDDASTDSTIEVIKNVADVRMHYVRNVKNMGVSYSRNVGVYLAKGNLVAFQDSDDEWRIEKLAKQLHAFRSGGSGLSLVVCGDLCLNHYSMSYEGVASDQVVVDVTGMTVMRLPPAPCWLASKSELLRVGGFDERLNCFEDWELALRLSERGRVVMVNEPLVLRQKTPGSLFSSERSYIPNLKLIFDLHGARLREHPEAWAAYCNLLGQSLCQFESCPEGRAWFLRALAARPFASRTWANLAFSMTGSAAFSRYVGIARSLRSRHAAPVRPQLYTGRS